MKKIPRELWLGNIYPAEDALKMTTEMKDIGRLIERNMEDLMSTLTEQQKETFEKYIECQEELSIASEREIFVYAFRLWVQITADCLGG